VEVRERILDERTNERTNERIGVGVEVSKIQNPKSNRKSIHDATVETVDARWVWWWSGDDGERGGGERGGGECAGVRQRDEREEG
jgi:hypothetical protein